MPMKLTQDVITSISNSVLCWLATVSNDGLPNVSPKEIFTNYGEEHIIIANIASPQSERNIEQNNQVCVSFIDILLQKGFQLKGQAEIIKQGDLEFMKMEKVLTKFTEGKFPFESVFSIHVHSIKPIIAPKYWLYPETTEAEQIESARKLYGI